jgi:hypothetical protein
MIGLDRTCLEKAIWLIQIRAKALCFGLWVRRKTSNDES